MEFSVSICLLAFVLLVRMLRRDRISLGLPIAYLYSLLLIHVPGAFVHIFWGEALLDTDLVEWGFGLTTIGTVCFVIGVWFARFGVPSAPIHHIEDNRRFWLFCLFSGWLFTYAVTPLVSVSSFGAVVEKAGGLWMLGALLGLRASVGRGDTRWVGFWLIALSIYPALMLLLGGFLSFGSKTVIVVLAILCVSVRSKWRVAAGILVISFVGFNMFLAYFNERSHIREAVWGGASIERRLETVGNMIDNLQLFDPSNDRHLSAIDQRLNQNYFVGLAAARIQNNDAHYVYGRSLSEGLMALVPRVFWPDKPVFAGSPGIVMEMTGLVLSETTAWGVGNVMEFYINFGIPSLVAGFVLLGWLLGWLDRKAALAASSGDFGRALIFFLPAVALIEPNGSIVEITAGPAAALIAAYFWQWTWHYWLRRQGRLAIAPNRNVRLG